MHSQIGRLMKILYKWKRSSSFSNAYSWSHPCTMALPPNPSIRRMLSLSCPVTILWVRILHSRANSTQSLHIYLLQVIEGIGLLILANFLRLVNRFLL